jgi:peptidoglycan/xylan/chitin deacetylase (PgdA/CDA1 family)/folate-dependent phosphoribosylglycinamide formyltransferase PurN
VRVVVFTGNPDLFVTEWWRIVAEQPLIDAVLVCRQTRSRAPREVWRRFRRNVSYHGWLFIPYRAAVLAFSLLRRGDHDEPGAPAYRFSVEEIEAADVHAPDVVQRVRDFKPDLGLSIGAPILKPSLFGAPLRGTLNLHLGQVPEFRGAPPAFWELMRGASRIGATVHWVESGLDTGAVIAAAAAPIYKRDTLKDVEARAAELGAHVFRSAVAAALSGDVAASPQQPTTQRPNRFPTLSQRMRLGLRVARRRAVDRLRPRTAAKLMAMAVALYVYRPMRDAMRRARRRHPVRVFTYHRVSDLCRDGMTVSPRIFREQVRYIARHCDIVTLSQGVELIRSGARLSRPVAVLTFDDAYKTVYEAARPVLARHAVPACCFVSTRLVGTTGEFEHDRENPVRSWLQVMNWQDLADVSVAGWEIGSHTATHARLSSCRDADLCREIQEPRATLRERLGVEARAIAFPFGTPADISDEAVEAARRAGHSVMFANYDGENKPGQTSFVLGRFDIGGDHDAFAWRALVHGLDLGKLKWLWPA